MRQPPSDKNLLAQGRELGSRHKWDEAEAVLRKYYLSHPDSVEAVVLHSEALLELHQPFDAALELQSFLKEHPDAVRPLELHAVIAVGSLRDRLLAQSDLEKAVQLSPNDFQAWKSLGDIYLDELQPGEAVSAYSHAAHLRPDDAVTSADLASALGKSGDSAKAENEFRRATALASRPSTAPLDRAIVNYLYGRFLLDSGKADLAVTALDAALAINPGSADAYYWRARAYSSQHKLDLAIADATHAMQLDQQNKDAPYLLLGIYREKGDTVEARKYADIVQKLSSREQSQAELGRKLRDTLDQAESLLHQGRFDEASTQYEAIVAMLPSFYEAYFGLGMCYAQTGRSAEAEDAFRKYLAMQPLSSDGHAALGVLLLEQHRPVDAIEELNKALAIDPTMEEARNALARAYLENFDPAHAVRILQSTKANHDRQTSILLAAALSQNGQKKDALAELNRILAADPTDAEARKLKEQITGSTE